MKQGCKLVNLGESTAIICGGEPTDHQCNEDAICYDTNEGRFFFKNSEDARKWYDDNYKSVVGGSVACSICGRASIDNAMWLI
jgi:hypothetical protein